MQSSQVIITLVDERLGKRRFVYNEPWICLVGRAEDCDIMIPSDTDHLQVSRHHCLLEIHPPVVRVVDLGSTNGTFVNGEKLPANAPLPTPQKTQSNNAAATELKEGDEVRLGWTPLRLQIQVASAR